MELLRLRNISKNYIGTHALIGVDFAAAAGEVHAIVGENGAGKSTLMKILAGAIQPNSGSVELDGKKVQIRTPHHAFNLGIRTVYQEFSLIQHLTLTENILIGQMPVKSKVKWWVDWPEAHKQAKEILEYIGFKGISVRKTVSELSVSHQQMVEIAKALTVKPRILILDEPSAVLSKEELKHLFILIRKLKKESTLILYISHRLDEVFEIADKITVLKDGRLVGTVLPKNTNQNELIKMMVGRELKNIYPERMKKPGNVFLNVKNLTKINVFSDISFSVARGEILGMFGLVGSGRTDIARCIFGADLYTSGEIRIKGNITKARSTHDAVKLSIAYVTEDRQRDGLVLCCNISDNVSLATMERISRLSFINIKKRDEQVNKMIDKLSILPRSGKKIVSELSGGNQQKVVLAKWLLAEASILILDEPTRGVDVATKVEIYNLVAELADNGVCIILISSELPEILGMCDRTIVIREGKIAGKFTKEESTEEKLFSFASGVAI